MNDLISRQAAIDAIFSEPLYKSGMKKRDADEVVPAIYEKIKALPSTQPEIIRCKDCKYAHFTYDGDCKYCDKWLDDDDIHLTLYLDGDFYCGYAERRTNE